MGRKKWKVGLCVIGMAVIGMLGYWIYDIQMRPDVIPPSEKVLLSDQLDLDRLLGDPSLDLWAMMIWAYDEIYVIEGTVTDQRTQWGDTVNTVALKQVWYGDIPEETETIPVWMWEEKDEWMSKPEVGDSILIFLEKHDYYNEKDTYWPIDLDHSIFHVKRGRIYAYSNTEELSQYDGKRISTLVNDFSEKVERYIEAGNREQAYLLYMEYLNEVRKQKQSEE